MTPVEEVLSGARQWATVEADCRKVLSMLPEVSVDHCLSDPPFSEHVHAVGRMDKAIRAGERGFGFTSLTGDLRSLVCSQLARVVRRWSIIFTDAEGLHAWKTGFEEAGIQHVRTGAWVKPGALPQMSGDRPSAGFEALEIAHPKGRKRWNGGGKPAVWTHPVERGGERVHPTQKPRLLLVELLDDFTDPGDLILDPFCGSGGIGIACVRLGRRYIGIDNGKDANGKPWAEWAMEGIEAELAGSTRAAHRAGQLALFGAK